MTLRTAERINLAVILAFLPNFSAEAKQIVIIPLIDAEIAVFTSQIDQFQASYIKQAGKGDQYYQMLWSHTTLPADGFVKVADGLILKPTDRPDNGLLLWQNLKASDLTSRYRMRVDNYDGPKGKGYVVVYQVEITKGFWQRSVNFGPETHRNQAWRLVAPEDL